MGMTPIYIYYADTGLSELSSLWTPHGQEGLGLDAGIECSTNDIPEALTAG